jgi:hypothetical protein
MQVHDITHYLGKKSNWMAHLILQREVKIVSTIIVVFGDCTFWLGGQLAFSITYIHIENYTAFYVQI